MSLDKAIRYGKEKRRPYRGSKAVDASCRNHGSCPWCRRNREHRMRDRHADNSLTYTYNIGPQVRLSEEDIQRIGEILRGGPSKDVITEG